MISQTYTFEHRSTNIIFLNESLPETNWQQILDILPNKNVFFVTDENVYQQHVWRFPSSQTFVFPAGENQKTVATVEQVIQFLLAGNADRHSVIVGVGGGVVTDLVAFVAAIYQRGIACALVPTSLLAMVDAAIGGKNGVNSGLYKNMIGTIRQPDWICYDITFLASLPTIEWIHGFAEIIKHACIGNVELFRFLQNHSLSAFQTDSQLLFQLIRTNVEQKLQVVQQDEWEHSIRKYLNFGHTLGHAIERMYHLSHGFAVAIGMIFACQLSKQLLQFTDKETVAALIQQYKLPTHFPIEPAKIISLMQNDKKKQNQSISWVLLESIGQPKLYKLSIPEIYPFLEQFQHQSLFTNYKN
ncbi:MAG: 3-dehydroquinate synthase [Bacteroidia bacterium]|nr:3-dehydroquinate synthase [Bacteroidia bacterium]